MKLFDTMFDVQDGASITAAELASRVGAETLLVGMLDDSVVGRHKSEASSSKMQEKNANHVVL